MSVGPAVNWAAQSHSKTMQLSQVFGDLANAWAWYGIIYDPDCVDHPIYDIGI